MVPLNRWSSGLTGSSRRYSGTKRLRDWLQLEALRHLRNDTVERDTP